MTKPDQFDNSHPYLWLLLFLFFAFWFMQWAG